MSMLITGIPCEEANAKELNKSLILVPDEKIDIFQENGVIKFSYCPDSNITINISGMTLSIDHFPEEEKFNYIMIDLIDQEGNEIDSRNFNGQYSIDYDLGGVPDGIYYLEIYLSSNRFGTYSSYISSKQGLQLEIWNEEISFILPETYEGNILRYKSRREDKNALEYYLLSTEGIECNNKEIIKLAKEITDYAVSDYEKVLTIHDWVCSNIWYDYDLLNDSTDNYNVGALDTLHSKRSLCQGYASLTAALLRAVNIPAKVVNGYALGNGTDGQWNKKTLETKEVNHAWNEAYVDGRWIVLDTTWDSNNIYQDGEFYSPEDIPSHLYFDVTMEIFSLTHKLVSDDSEVDKYYQKKEQAELIALQKVNITSSSYILYLSENKRHTAKLSVNLPEDMKDYSIVVSYKSSNGGIINVDKYGKVTAVGKGKATITATIMVGEHKLIQKITLQVK